MKYRADLHPNHGKPWTMPEQNYLIEHFENDGTQQISLALGRTEATIASKVQSLRKSGAMSIPERKIKHRNRGV
jgi:biotin operon repressor